MRTVRFAGLAALVAALAAVGVWALWSATAPGGHAVAPTSSSVARRAEPATPRTAAAPAPTPVPDTSPAAPGSAPNLEDLERLEGEERAREAGRQSAQHEAAPQLDLGRVEEERRERERLAAEQRARDEQFFRAMEEGRQRDAAESAAFQAEVERQAAAQRQQLIDECIQRWAESFATQGYLNDAGQLQQHQAECRTLYG